ncbi:MAG: hypothetical protein ACLQVI_02695 [Polyangiaceae bacterium]
MSASGPFARFGFPVLAFVALGVLPLAGCGGSSTGVTSGPDASVSPSDGGGSSDGSVSEASPDEDSGSTTPPDDGGSGADAADAGSCDTLATRAACVDCCDTTFAGGLGVFDVAVEECACAANLCGPTDGGSDDGGDGGDLGVGACSGTCGTTTTPKATCEKCVLDTLGTAADPGPCRATVTSACASSTPCKRYVACTDGCPAK